MKIAITGKGGTGKTTMAGILSHFFNRDGYQVLAIDADPDANLASALGIPPEKSAEIIPIAQQRQLIKERTGAESKQFGQMFKINPFVKDIADKFCYDHQGIKLLVMGGIKKGGEGCACPENVLLKNLLSELILHRDEVVIVDMEAGIEHLGRATSQAIDKMIMVVEPGTRSILSAKRIMQLARDIGVSSFGIIGNKIQSQSQKEWIQNQFSQGELLGEVFYHEIIQNSDLNDLPLIEELDEAARAQFEHIYKTCCLHTNG